MIKRILKGDLPQLGIRVPTTQLHRFRQMLAHWQGQAMNASKFATNFGVSASTVRHYLDNPDGHLSDPATATLSWEPQKTPGQRRKA